MILNVYFILIYYQEQYTSDSERIAAVIEKLSKSSR